MSRRESSEDSSDLDIPLDCHSLVTPELAPPIADAIANEIAKDDTPVNSSESTELKNEFAMDDTEASKEDLEASISPENSKVSQSPLSEAFKSPESSKVSQSPLSEALEASKSPESSKVTQSSLSEALEASKSPESSKVSQSPLSEALETLALSDNPAKNLLTKTLSDSSDGKGTPRRGKVRVKATPKSHESPYKTRSKVRLLQEKETRSKSEESGRK